MKVSIEDIGELIEKRLKAVPMPETPHNLYDPVSYTLGLGGKRIRPALVLLSAGMCNGELEKAVPLALGIEMLHNFTLIHDDIMDHALTRRGKACVHVRWNEATAILSGDVLFVMAMQQVASINTVSHSEDVMALFLDRVKSVCEGQAMDMAFQEDHDVSLDDYLEMIRLKTAALIEGAMLFGAISAKADTEQQHHCSAIGRHAGLAFQIQDDLLDVIGDPGRTGKKYGGDISEGKKTFLSIRAFERADDTDRLILEQVIGDVHASEQDLLRVTKIYHDLGVIDEAVKTISVHYEKALGHLAFFEENEYQNEIKQILDKLRVRDY